MEAGEVSVWCFCCGLFELYGHSTSTVGEEEEVVVEARGAAVSSSLVVSGSPGRRNSSSRACTPPLHYQTVRTIPIPETMSAKGKGPAPRLGTPLSSNQERSNAPSPSPAPFDPSDVGVGVIPGSSRAPFGSGRGGRTCLIWLEQRDELTATRVDTVERAGSPLKRYTSTRASRQVGFLRSL